MTHYIDFAAGSDGNNGTAKGTPWQYAPGMPGCSSNCAAYSHSAGDHFIFKGGVTWQNTAPYNTTVAPWSISNSGAGDTLKAEAMK